MEKLQSASDFGASSRGNFYRAIIKLINYIIDSPHEAFGTNLNNAHYTWLTRAKESWKTYSAAASHEATIEAGAKNTIEEYQRQGRWATMSEVMQPVLRRVRPYLQRLTTKEALSDDERNAFVNCLFCLLYVVRAGRAGSYGGTYVSARSTSTRANVLF